jgi:hypothetical protein
MKQQSGWANLLAKLSSFLYKISSWQTILIATAVYAAFLAGVMIPHGAEMQSFAGDWGAPDGHLFYTPEALYSHLATWGDAGRQHYIDFRLGLDPLWALSYTAFLVTVISVALRRATAASDSRRAFNLWPLAPMLADLTENMLGIIVVANYPNQLDWLVWVTASVSCFKWLSLILAHLLMIYALVIASMSIAQRARSS